MEHLKHASDQAGERGGRCGTKKKMKGESSALAFFAITMGLAFC